MDGAVLREETISRFRNLFIEEEKKEACGARDNPVHL
jgi:hypothetical protein